MIDLHCHILPGIDDGPESLRESIAMCRMAVADGISKVVCSPHHMVGKYDNNREKIIRSVRELQISIDSEHIPLTVCPGCEIRLDLNLVEKITSGDLMTVNDSGRYIILELPGEALPQNIEEIIFSLIFAGFIPIIAHPERNEAIRRTPEILSGLIQMGSLAQLTTSSLTGRFGRSIERFSIFLLEHNLVHMLVTDAHSSRWRRPLLSRGLKRLKEIVGEQTAMMMVEATPEKVLKGEDIDTKFPIPLEEKSPSRITSFLKRAFN